MTQSIDLGRLRFFHRGAYNGATTYEVNDVVTYGGAGYVYIYATNASGNLPTNTTYWSKLVDGIDPRSDWATSTAYYPGDVVVRGGAAYHALLAHTSGTFSTDLAAGKWETLVRGMRWRSSWATSTSYLKDDVVYYDGNAYIATADFSSNASSFANDVSWELFSQGGLNAIPSQAGNSGEFLTTDGSSVSWSPNLVTAVAGTANEVEVSAATGSVTIGLPNNVTVGANLTVSNNLTVNGDLTVSGTTTTINTATLSVADNIIILNSDVTAEPSENAGIEVERGTSTNVLIRWNESTDIWEATNDGTTYTAILGWSSDAVLKSTFDAKGDLLVGSADNTVTKLSVGANGLALKANSSTASGLEWGPAGVSGDDEDMIVAVRIFR